MLENTIGLKSGDKVIESDGNVGVIYDIYSHTKVSLCIEGYDEVGDMVERDSLTDVRTLKLKKQYVNRFQKKKSVY